MRHNVDAWDPYDPSVSLSAGPIRVVVDQPDPDFQPRPVGFTAHIEPLEDEGAPA